MSITFELQGQGFIALNGGPHYKFSPAISLFVGCPGRGKVDELWEKLSEGSGCRDCPSGSPGHCHPMRYGRGP
jgi:predicted 3-demethylubiquinone-9 3-methyltransferase (glyoxalase superfamily)